MRPIEVETTHDWPPELAAFAAAARVRSFAAGPAFRRAMVEHVPDWSPCSLVARRGGAVVGVLPGYLARKAGGAWFFAQPLGLPGGPLLAAESGPDDDVAVVGALWQGLAAAARREGWLGGRVVLQRPASAVEALWPPRGLGEMRVDEAHVADLSHGYEAWLASLRRRARKQLTLAEGRGVTVAESRDPDDLERVHALHLAQAREWGQREVRPVAFYQSLFAPPSSARLWVARAGGAIVSGVLAFVEPDETYLWWSGSAPASRELLAFPLLLARILAECGSPRVNLGFSGGRRRLTDFKEQMGAVVQRVPILHLAPRPRTPYHALLALAARVLRG